MIYIFQILITSNDSRIRLYSLKDHSLHCKYKGFTNSSSQIKGSFRLVQQYTVTFSIIGSFKKRTLWYEYIKFSQDKYANYSTVTGIS